MSEPSPYSTIISQLGEDGRARIAKMARQKDRRPNVLRFEENAPHEDWLLANRLHGAGLLVCYAGRYGSRAEYELTDLGERVALCLAKPGGE